MASYAARFAAKEAFAKALGTGFFSEGITPREVWVEREASKRPLLVLSEKSEAALRRQDFETAEVSLSHHGDYAMAIVALT